MSRRRRQPLSTSGRLKQRRQVQHGAAPPHSIVVATAAESTATITDHHGAAPPHSVVVAAAAANTATITAHHGAAPPHSVVAAAASTATITAHHGAAPHHSVVAAAAESTGTGERPACGPMRIQISGRRVTCLECSTTFYGLEALMAHVSSHSAR
jgi:hypothetical protein